MDRSLKGLVLSGGKGSRLRPLTFAGAKQLVPIANKPVLFYALEQLAAAGVDDIAIVVSPETGEQVRQACGDGSRFGARISYVEQSRPGGIAQAIGVARGALGDAPFVTVLGDNFLRGGISPYVQSFAGSGAAAGVLLKDVPNPRDCGVAVFEGERLVRVVEKPAEPPTSLAVIGIYMFTARVFDAIDSIQPSARGELEITDAIQWLLDAGDDVRTSIVAEDWIDTGKHDDLLAANRMILEDLQEERAGASIDEATQLHGRVTLQPGCEVRNSIISGPAIIGERTRIVDSYIGPFTSIGADCTVRKSEIAGSVVMDGTAIEHVADRIENSLIGRNVELRASERLPRGYQLVLGDYSKLRLP